MAAVDSPENVQSTPVMMGGADAPPPPIVSDASQEIPTASPQPQQSATPEMAQTPPSPKRRFPKIVLILLVVFVFILIAVGVASLLMKKGEGGSESGEIVWWGLWEDESIISPIIEEYQSNNSEIKITYVRQAKEDYRERLISSLAQGDGPDIFRFHNTWVPMFKKDLDKLPSSVMNASDYAQTFYPVTLTDLSSGSGIVGIPLGYDAIAMFVNEEIFEESGKDYPTTWNELRKTAKEMTIKDEVGQIIQSGAALGRTENVDHWPEILGLMMLQNSVNLAKPSGQLAEDALTFYTLFSKADGIWDASLPASTIAFSGGKVAVYFGPSWRAFEIKLQNPTLRFKTVPVPQLPKTEIEEADVVYATYWVEGVWEKSNNKKAAWDFLKYLTEQSTLQKMYADQANTRLFGEPYPRVDMAEMLIDDPFVGSIIQQASSAQSWYLASRTFDGPTGINTRVNSYYENALNAVIDGEGAEKALESVVAGMDEVLSAYGLSTR